MSEQWKAGLVGVGALMGVGAVGFALANAPWPLIAVWAVVLICAGIMLFGYARSVRVEQEDVRGGEVLRANFRWDTENLANMKPSPEWLANWRAAGMPKRFPPEAKSLSA